MQENMLAKKMRLKMDRTWGPFAGHSKRRKVRGQIDSVNGKALLQSWLS